MTTAITATTMRMKTPPTTPMMTGVLSDDESLTSGSSGIALAVYK